MKKLFVLLCLGIATASPMRTHAQAEEIAQLLLNVEKLAQFRGILSDMKKGYEILSGGYNTIKNISEGNFSIHKTFLDGLMQVSPEVRNYRKVACVIEYQLQLIREYRGALTRFKASALLSPDELAYMERVYTRLFNASLKNLDELLLVITADNLRMSDKERLESIDRIYDEMADKLGFVRSFNSSSSLLLMQREKESGNINASKALISITND